MKKIAYLLNVLLLAALFIDILFWPPDWSETPVWMLFILVVLFATPLVNILALIKPEEDKNFISLYFERKGLEQKKRIVELKKSIDEKSYPPATP